MSNLPETLLCALVFVLGCSIQSGCSVQTARSVPLLDPTAMTPVSLEDDPLADHRPAEVDCPPATWGPEGGGFEIQTGACNYASFDQPLPVPLERGDELSIIVWHDLLDAPEPANAHVAVWVGETVVWETEIAIPAPSTSFEVVVPIQTTPPPDARLGFHLHNHGYNSWKLIAIDRIR